VSRRQHVVRTDDQAGIGTSRSLGGCEIICAVAEGGDVEQGESAFTAPITVVSTRNYRRCYVSATISRIVALVPDPPPPPQWKSFSVTYVPEPVVGQPETARWISDPFDISLVGGVAEIDDMHYVSVPYVSYAWQQAFLYLDNGGGGYSTLGTVPSGNGIQDMGNIAVSADLSFTVMNAAFDTQVTLLMRADTDLSVDGVGWTISTGHWVTQETPGGL
jgi:hypothetical protein